MLVNIIFFHHIKWMSPKKCWLWSHFLEEGSHCEPACPCTVWACLIVGRQGEGPRTFLPSCPCPGVSPHTERKSHLIDTYYHGPCSFAKKGKEELQVTGWSTKKITDIAVNTTKSFFIVPILPKLTSKGGIEGYFGGFLSIDPSPCQIAVAYGIGCHGDEELHPQITAKLPPGIDQGLCLPNRLRGRDLWRETVSFGCSCKKRTLRGNMVNQWRNPPLLASHSPSSVTSPSFPSKRVSIQTYSTTRV